MNINCSFLSVTLILVANVGGIVIAAQCQANSTTILLVPCPLNPMYSCSDLAPDDEASCTSECVLCSQPEQDPQYCVSGEALETRDAQTIKSCVGPEADCHFCNARMVWDPAGAIWFTPSQLCGYEGPCTWDDFSQACVPVGMNCVVRLVHDVEHVVCPQPCPQLAFTR